MCSQMLVFAASWKIDLTYTQKLSSYIENISLLADKSSIQAFTVLEHKILQLAS